MLFAVITVEAPNAHIGFAAALIEPMLTALEVITISDVITHPLPEVAVAE